MSNFNFTSQVCTSRSQSERLIALGLKKETADMYHLNYGPIGLIPFIRDSKYHLDEEDIPAWSLHRLIEIAGIRAFSPVSSLNGWYDDIIAQIQSSIHIGYIDEKYLNMDIVNAHEEKNMELLKNN